MSFSENIKKQSTISMLMVSVFVGLIAAGLAVLYLKNREAAYALKYKQEPVEMVTVAVPIRDLMAGEVISNETVAAREIPADFVDPNVITPLNYDKAKGRRLQQPATQGKPIPLAYLSGLVMGDFSDSVTTGRRAVTIKVDRINSMDGMLRPGNHIDIMVGMPAEQAGMDPIPGKAESGKEEVLFPVLENVVVMATGDQDAKSAQDQRPGSMMTDKDYSSVTLDLFPEQVAMIKTAEQAGRIVASLRNRNDVGTSGFDGVRPSQLMALMKKARNAELARASGEIVQDANGNVLGKVVGDTVFDAQGNVVGKVNSDGQVVDASGKVVGQKSRVQLAIGPDCKPIGNVVGGKVFDSNNNPIGRVVEGKVISDDGRLLGQVSESSAVDANGNEMGSVVNGVACDKNGNIIGKVDANGRITDSKGNVIGGTVGKVALGANGKPIGKVVGNKVLDSKGNVIGHIDAKGNVVDLQGKVVGSVADNVQAADVAVDKNGKVLGKIVDGKVIDAMGNVVGTVAADGTITDANGNVIGTKVEGALVDAKGNIVANEAVGADGKPIGKVIGDKVYDKDGKVVATVGADGKVKSLDGKVLDVAIKPGVASAPTVTAQTTVADPDTGTSASVRSYEMMSGGNQEKGVLKLENTTILPGSEDPQALPQGK